MGDENSSSAVAEQTNVSTTVPIHTSADTPVKDEASNGFSIPDEFKDKAYLKDVTSMSDVFKKLDGAQNLIGQKVVFPNDDTSDEARLAFSRAAGMPEKAEDYKFTTVEGIERDVAFDSKIKQLFHESELSGRAATKLQDGFERLMEEVGAAQTQAQDAAFDELSSKILGDRKEEILASGKTLLEENVPEGLEDAVQNLSNEALVTMAAIFDNFKTKYIDEDSINDKNKSGGESGADELRKKGQELLAHPARNDPFHPDHKKINEQVVEIYAQIGKVSK